GILLLDLLHFGRQLLHLDAEVRLLAADGKHGAADDDREKDDRQAKAAKAQIVKLVQKPVHEAGDGNEQIGPPAKSAIIGQCSQMELVGVAIDELRTHRLAAAELVEKLSLYRPVVEQKLMRHFLAGAELDGLAVDSNGNVVEKAARRSAAA